MRGCLVDDGLHIDTLDSLRLGDMLHLSSDSVVYCDLSLKGVQIFASTCSVLLDHYDCSVSSKVMCGIIIISCSYGSIRLAVVSIREIYCCF